MSKHANVRACAMVRRNLQTTSLHCCAPLQQHVYSIPPPYTAPDPGIFPLPTRHWSVIQQVCSPSLHVIGAATHRRAQKPISLRRCVGWTNRTQRAQVYSHEGPMGGLPAMREDGAVQEAAQEGLLVRVSLLAPADRTAPDVCVNKPTSTHRTRYIRQHTRYIRQHTRYIRQHTDVNRRQGWPICWVDKIYTYYTPYYTIIRRVKRIIQLYDVLYVSYDVLHDVLYDCIT
eukprot:2171073-Pyramimonas_sp.AAC.2